MYFQRQQNRNSSTSALSNDSSPGDDDDEEPLPPGWGMSKAPNGRMFFIDHNNKTTTWVGIPFSGTRFISNFAFNLSLVNLPFVKVHPF